MRFLYNISIYVSSALIWISQFFTKKLNLFVKGRKEVFTTLRNSISKDDETIWFHCASLGEFEQGLPIINYIKENFKNYKLIITFFSPSGYEIKKRDPIADCMVYLPLDTQNNNKLFLKLVHPSLAIFIKYEFWPNYLFQLKKREVPTILVSGLFRKDQIFFKPYGGFMRRALKSFNHIFVQDEFSESLLNSINIKKVTVSGDTRFDRVSNQLLLNNSLDFIKQFKGASICIVYGSTWIEDEAVLIDYINKAPETVKFIIAPHIIEANKIEVLRRNITKKSILFSEKNGRNLSDYQVLIINTIGLLTKIYSDADIAYVGGAMGKTGLHNILEPATFGIPIVIGKHFMKFPEAKKLKQMEGLFSVANAEECFQILNSLVGDEQFRIKTGKIAKEYVSMNTGATKKVSDYIDMLLKKDLI